MEELKNEVCNANLKLVEYGLVTLTWGNVSAINRTEGLVVIKPSGIDYDKMDADDMVVVDLDGKLIEGKWKPSSDTPTHIELYKAFPQIGGISHTHSINATIFAQAKKEIPCFGTTHADHFYGNVPLTRVLSENEVVTAYEKFTGTVIIERFKELDPLSIPGILVASHAPFTWGKSAMEAINNSLILERIAEMALGTLAINNKCEPIEQYVLDKHYFRKHGANSYYGQNKK
ncbi:MAG: L-ribulose-5-phosphate 4-epimerase [Bacteroidetes bacterium]|nr:L-ribulose-5-phosphate 4-epimerase [Bacteroidota bacterium]MBU1115224.1 L-ribulose-5-phosphate 4-epimerase [Bacteroidota bacterium]MBU1797242.1 L-ribulose-5-phosphate 4-epimerase [Bacteroidota bacterium]